MTTPQDLLSRFSTAWNDLRNAVIGQSATKPANVTQALYDKTGNYYERWRKYLAQMPAPMAALPVQALVDWVLQYREIANEAKAEGLTFTEFPVGMTEELVGKKNSATDAEDAGGWGSYIAMAAIVLVVPLVIALSRSKKRRR